MGGPFSSAEVKCTPQGIRTTLTILKDFGPDLWNEDQESENRIWAYLGKNWLTCGTLKS